ncbi:MAG TPA: EAL domain-containing protein [Gemmatimonadaceae bacterium]|nr:EAL domain-containing protein [Gemmatimonadaceae bacterium]
MEKSAGRVLIVDDEAGIRRLLTRALERAGFEADQADDGLHAMDLLDTSTFDVVISDLRMPGMGGMDLLRRVREHDLDLPVVLMTGAPSIETAVEAVEYGALRYLMKPVSVNAVVEAALYGVRMRQMARLKREAIAHLGVLDAFPGDRVGLETGFSRALDALSMAYHPIVSAARRAVYGYEALLRSGESSMPDPVSVLDAAERLGRICDLGRSIRSQVAAASRQLAEETLLFVNLHPLDLQDAELFARGSPLSAIAGRVVLEVTERASLDAVHNVRERTAALRDIGFRIAVDDLGSGYAGLSSLLQLQPDVVKLDISLIRSVDVDLTKQRLIRSMTELCEDMGILVVAEGVETPAERDVVVQLGCDLLQGYVFARPARSFVAPAWPA